MTNGWPWDAAPGDISPHESPGDEVASTTGAAKAAAGGRERVNERDQRRHRDDGAIRHVVCADDARQIRRLPRTSWRLPAERGCRQRLADHHGRRVSVVVCATTAYVLFTTLTGLRGPVLSFYALLLQRTRMWMDSVNYQVPRLDPNEELAYVRCLPRITGNTVSLA